MAPPLDSGRDWRGAPPLAEAASPWAPATVSAMLEASDSGRRVHVESCVRWGSLMPTRPRAYLASPLGFSEAGRHFYQLVLIPFVRDLGFEVLDPWILTDRAKLDAVRRMSWGRRRRDAWRVLNREIGRNNRAAIDRARGVVAVLDGVDVDSGTAAEVGYAFARGKLIVGYRGDFRLSADNEGGTVNLQVEYFIRQSGGTIVERYQELEAALRPLRAANA